MHWQQWGLFSQVQTMSFSRKKYSRIQCSDVLTCNTTKGVLIQLWTISPKMHYTLLQHYSWQDGNACNATCAFACFAEISFILVTITGNKIVTYSFMLYCVQSAFEAFHQWNICFKNNIIKPIIFQNGTKRGDH